MGEVGQRTATDGDEYAPCVGEELCTRHHHHDDHYPVVALASAKCGHQVDAKDGETFADHERAPGEVQR